MTYSKGEWRIKDTLGEPEIITDTRRIATVWYHGGSEDNVRLGTTEQRIRLYSAIHKATGEL